MENIPIGILASVFSTASLPISFVAASPAIGSQVTGSQINLPAGLQQNDFVLVVSAADTGTPSIPTGFTSILQGNINSVGYMIAYKFMGTTPDTVASGLTNNGTTTHTSLAFRNVSLSNPYSGGASVTTSDNTPLPTPVITTTNDSLVVLFGFHDDDLVASNVIPPTGYTMAGASQSSSGGATVMTAYGAVAVAAAGTTVVPARFTFSNGATDSAVGASIALNKA